MGTKSKARAVQERDNEIDDSVSEALREEHRGKNRIRDQKELAAEIREAEALAKKNKSKEDGKKGSRVSDGAGLFVYVPLRVWRLDYRYPHKVGARQTITLGSVDEVTLAQARQARNDAWALIAAGTNPTAARKEKRAKVKHAAVAAQRAAKGQTAPGSFGYWFELWHKTKAPAWTAGYARKVKSRVERNLLPFIGAMSIDEITEKDLLVPLRRVQSATNRQGGNKIESAHTARGYASQVFLFAIAEGECERNPAQELAKVLTPVLVTNRAAIIEPHAFAKMLHVINDYPSPVTRAALLFLASTGVRPGNVAKARWRDLDLTRREWRIPSSEMKRSRQEKLSGKPFVVPLVAETIALLREVEPLSRDGEFAFVASHTSKRPMSENTLNFGLRRLGIGQQEQSAHGFRASLRTIAEEHLRLEEAVLEEILAHSKPGLGTAYNRVQFAHKKREALAKWGAVVAHAARTGEWAPEVAARVVVEPDPAEPQAIAVDAQVAALIERVAGKGVAAKVARELAKLAAAQRAPATSKRAASKPASRPAKGRAPLH